MSWSEVSFESLYAAPSRNGVYKPKEFHGSGCRIVNMGELFAYDVIPDVEMSRLRLTDAELRRSALEQGDLLFARRSLIESGAGKCAIVGEMTEPTTFESSIIRVRVDRSRVLPEFLRYWFASHQGRGRMRAIVTGTNVKGIKGSTLKSLLIPIPEIDEQQEIVSVLSAYDDLIANNRRRIETLEEAARLLYQEWFIALRFPGSEEVAVQDRLPDGWKRTTIDQVANTIGGGTPSSKKSEYWADGDVTWFTPTDITGSHGLVILDSNRKITREGLAGSSAKMLPPMAIMMSSRASVGFFGLCPKSACTNQGFISSVPHTANMRMFLLFNLMARVEEIDLLASGATYKEINKSSFRSMIVDVPPDSVLDQFEAIVAPILDQVLNLTSQIEELEKARDILLPRLMSGEVTV